jgi:hypothetical protein
MKFRFTLDTSSIAKLESVGRAMLKNPLLSSSIIRIFPEDNIFKILFSGSRDTITQVLPISDFAVEEGNINANSVIFFAVKTSNFLNILNKVLSLKKDVLFTIHTTADTSKLELKVDQSRFTTSSFDTSFDGELVLSNYKRIPSFLEDKEFIENTASIIVNNEIFTYYDSVVGNMKINQKANAIAILSENLYYADNMMILNYKGKNEFVDSASFVSKVKTVYLHQIVYSYLKDLGIHETIVTISKSGDFAYFKDDNIGIEALISLPETKCRLPTKEDIDNITPEPNNHIAVSIKKEDLLKGIKQFQGIFSPDSWRNEQLFFTFSDNNDEKSLRVSYCDSVTEAEIYISLAGVTNPSNVAFAEFLVPSYIIKNAFNLISDDEVSLIFNDIDLQEEHGSSIRFLATNYDVIIAKLGQSHN